MGEPLTISVIRSIAQRVTYKPNCRIRIDAMGDERYSTTVAITIESNVLDSVHRKHEVTIIFRDHMDIHWFENGDDVIRWIRDCVHRWERHEADEWFRFDGNLVHDPHGSEVVAKR